MMRLTHFDGLRTNKTSSLKSTVFDTKEYINTRDKVRKNLTSLTTTNSYERIKNTRTGSNSLLPIELDDVPESCIPLYAHPEQRELYLELTRYADNPKMTVKDILIPLSHTLLMEQKYKASDLVLEKLSRPTKMKFVHQFITHIDRGSWPNFHF
ncbi:hypothetical protein K501DRAFT_300717 [Backusella circina FSU 941]|nr:hypothetical protein K501DRAFT_300717 [Backusella circina FSU 941]